MTARPSRARLRAVRMVAMDVDGVLTDGGLYYVERGGEIKKFNVRDGQGIVLLHQAGIATALITSKHTEIVARRAHDLGIAEVHQRVTDKLAVLRELLARHGIAPEEACYIGDDVGDLPAMRVVGLPVAVADAAPAVRRAARYVTRKKGGEGAVREICDLILKARATPPSR